MDRTPWPVVFLAGVVGGAVGTIGLAYLIAATKLDGWINHRTAVSSAGRRSRPQPNSPLT